VNAGEVVAALELPAPARVDRRVPKALLIEHGAPTATDRRHSQDHVEAVVWVAALKPATIGVAEHRDATHEYLEIQVIRLTTRDLPLTSHGLAARLEELVHRAVPYPVILVADDPSGTPVRLSAAHTRRSQGEAGAFVLDGPVVSFDWDPVSGSLTAAQRAALSLARQPRTSIFATYQGWIDTIVALKAGRITGAFRLDASPAQSADRLTALGECERIDREIGRLRAAAARERQVARQVELNLAVKQLEARKAAALERLA
jgi:hypothetical protein